MRYEDEGQKQVPPLRCGMTKNRTSNSQIQGPSPSLRSRVRMTTSVLFGRWSVGGVVGVAGEDGEGAVDLLGEDGAG